MKLIIPFGHEDNFGKTGVSIDGVPIYYNHDHAVFVWGGDSDARAATVQGVKDFVANKLVEAKQRQEATKRRKAQLADPVLVSAVNRSGRGVKGDFGLRGYHAGTATPLLANERGESAGFDPTMVRTLVLLERLTPEEWVEWEILVHEVDDADAAAKSTGREPRKITANKLAGERKVLVQDTTDGTGRKAVELARITYELQGTELVSTVLGLTVRAPSMADLSEEIADMLHPDRGQPVVVVSDGGETMVEELFERRRYARQQHRFSLFLETVRTELRAARAAQNRAAQARDAFIDKHLYTPKGDG